MVPPGLRFYWPAILDASNGYDLDPWLVAGIVCVESDCNTDAFRHNRNLWNRLLKKTEWAQHNPRRVSSNYGLMGVSFLDAVSCGFPQTDPPEALFMPAVNLEFGCRRLRGLQDRLAKFPASPDRLAALCASYHCGFQSPDALRPDGRDYAIRVVAVMEDLKRAAQLERMA